MADHNGYGKASLILGIIGICTVIIGWMGLSLYGGGVLQIWLYLFAQIPLGTISIIFGSIGYWIKKPSDTFGLAGCILGNFTLVYGLLFFTLALDMSPLY